MNLTSSRRPDRDASIGTQYAWLLLPSFMISVENTADRARQSEDRRLQ